MKVASPAQIIRAFLIQKGYVTMPPIDTTQESPTQQKQTPDGTIRTQQSGGYKFQFIPCYVGSMPNDSDFAVALFDNAGFIFGRRMRVMRHLTHPGIKVLVRGGEVYDDGYGLANNIANGLDSIVKATIVVNGTTQYVQSVYRVSPVVSLGEETGTRRQLYSLQTRVAFQDQQPSLG